MERLTPIRAVEVAWRQHGSFLLVGLDGKLKYWPRPAPTKELIESIRGRGDEMVKFLTALSECKG